MQVRRGSALPWMAGLLAITLIALAVRMYRLEGESIWFDEAVSVRFLDASSLGEFLKLERQNDPPAAPVYFSLEYLWAQLWGNTVYRVRMLSVVMGTLTVLCVGLFAWDLFGRVSGLLAAAFLAASPWHTYHSQEIRVYALVMLMAVVSTHAFWRARSLDQRGALAVNIALNALMVWTHVFAALLVGVQGLHMLVWRRRPSRFFRAWCTANGLILFSLVFYLIRLDYELLGQYASWIEPATLWGLVGGLACFLAGAILVWHMGLPLAVMSAARLAAGAGATGNLVYRVWGARRAADESGVPAALPEKVSLLVMWLVVPLLVLFIMAKTFRPCFVPRYVLYSLAAGCVLFGGGAGLVRTPKWRAISLATACAVVLYSLPLGLSERPFRTDYRSAVRVLEEEHAAPGRVLFLSGMDRYSLAEYLKSGMARLLGPVNAGEVAQVLAEEGQEAAWLVVTRHANVPLEECERALREQGLVFERYDVPFAHVYRVTRAAPS